MENSMRGFWSVLFVLLLWLLFGTAVPAYFLQPPKPLPTDAPADQFSAMRADSILKTLVGDGIPHPAGSEQNDIVRQRIVDLVKSFGYEEPTIHETETEDPWSSSKKKIPLENIMFRLKGKTDSPAIMLASHYDSVPSGPGASDDGVGTAALLEVARMLKKDEGQFERDIIFLLTDGEERGLLGAKKFCEEHPWAKEIACCINVEARGTEGQSYMFETSENSRWLIPLFAKTARRPNTSSIYFEVYQYLPNDTDFTIFKRANFQGYNFAFIRNVDRYHTDEDNYENADRSSMQHHGEQMLGLARELVNLDIDSQPSGRVVYFDLLGRALIWWPSSWSIWICGASLVLLLLPLTRKKKVLEKVSEIESANSHPSEESKPDRFRDVLISIFFVGLGTILTVVLGVGLDFGLRFEKAFEVAFPRSEFSTVVLLAFNTCAVLCAVTISFCFRNSVSANAMWNGTWLGWGMVSVLVTLLLPGACYLFLLPLAIAAILAVVFPRNESVLLKSIPAIATGFLWLPLLANFFDAFGFEMTPIFIALSCIAVTLIPTFRFASKKSQNVAFGMVGSTLVLCVIAISVATRMEFQ